MAKKKSHEEEIRSGLEKLRQLSLRPEESSADTVARLQQEIGKSREMDLGIVFSLGKIIDQKAVDALAAIEKRTIDKEVKKEVRRALFKLGQRGLAAPREEAAQSTPRSSFFSSAPEIEAYMSAVDGAGGRLIWIAKPQPNHGLLVMQAMIDDREGLYRIGGTHLRRKELRKMAEDIKAQHGTSMIAIPWEYADELVYEAYETAKALERGGLEHFHEIRAAVNPTKPKPQEHPIYRRLDASLVQEGAWRERSRRLLDEPELQYWILDEAWAKPFLAQLEAAQSSRLVLNPVQKEERFAGIVRDAVKTICAAEMQKRMQRRMEDMALYFSETGRQESAKLALAVALQIGAGDPGPLDISFLTGLVQKTFAFYLSQEKSKAAEEPSLIVKP